MTSFSARKCLTGWLQLIRLPNLLTVPGDPAAGFVLASLDGPSISFTLLIPCAISSILLYIAGLVLNDLVDIKEDRELRPDRPLARGMISRRVAVGACVTAIICALTLSFIAGLPQAITCSLLLASIFSYNCLTKNMLLAGSLNMGICRGLSMLLGASAISETVTFSPLVFTAMAGLTLYVSAVTFIAARETESVHIGILRICPALSIAICFTAIFFISDSVTLAFGILAHISVLWFWRQAKHLKGLPETEIIQPAVATFIRGLLLIQAAFSALMPGPGQMIAALILLLLPCSLLLSKWFYTT